MSSSHAALLIAMAGGLEAGLQATYEDRRNSGLYSQHVPPGSSGVKKRRSAAKSKKKEKRKHRK